MKPTILKNGIILALILIVSFANPLTGREITTTQWQVTDIEFSTRNVPSNPFEVIFGAILEHEEGERMEIPGFYNGEKNWILRFCPPREGTWAYTTYSSIESLTGQTGTVVAGPNPKTNEHGPLTISAENKRKLVYADGTPCFMLAYELDWLFALDAENRKDIPRTREIISHVKKNGFNKVVMNVFAYDAKWGDRESISSEHNFAEPKVFPFGGTNTDPDYGTLNIGFFKHLDRVMAHLDEQEILSHLMIYVWNKKVNWPDPNTPEDNLYFDYVVKRYQAFPNLVWDISKEALAYGRDDLGYITERIDRLRKLDGHHRLLTVHDYAYCKKYPGKVDIISVQDWKLNIYETTRGILDAHPGKPVFNIEHGGYEKTMHSIFDGAYNDAVACLKRNYLIIFAGAYSTYYWQNSSWYEVVYNPDELPEGRQPAFSYYANLNKLFTDYDFSQLSPLHTNAHTYCLTDQESLYMFYLPEDMISITGAMRELGGKTVKIRWFDPLRGSYMDNNPALKEMSPWLGVRKPEALQGRFCIAILEVQD
jgi:hypothetical protein